MKRMSGRASPGAARGSRPTDGPRGLAQRLTAVDAVSVAEKRFAIPMIDESALLALTHRAHGQSFLWTR